MCSNDNCDKRNKCLRYISTPSKYWQSYADFMEEDGSCNYFWQANLEQIKESKSNGDKN